jgi:hypothetical protein
VGADKTRGRTSMDGEECGLPPMGRSMPDAHILVDMLRSTDIFAGVDEYESAMLFNLRSLRVAVHSLGM